MDGRSSLPDSRRRRWHALVEHYTPDGWFGRVLLSLLTGSVASFGFFAAIALQPVGPLAFLTMLSWAALGVLGLLLTVAVLWPVYLSLIGNVESAARYRPGAGAVAAESQDWARTSPTGDATPESDDDALAILKRRYAAGELSEDAFERRLDALLEADEVARAETGSSGGVALEPERE